jgi:hypothetical protein
MRTILILTIATILTACSDDGPGGTASGSSATGETCSATADCLPGLRCIGAVCADPGAPGDPDALGGGDAGGDVQVGEGDADGSSADSAGAQDGEGGGADGGGLDAAMDGDGGADGDGDAAEPCTKVPYFNCENEKCACIDDIPLPLTWDEAHEQCLDKGVGFVCFEGTGDQQGGCTCSDDPAFRLTKEEAQEQCFRWIGDCDGSQS